MRNTVVLAFVSSLTALPALGATGATTTDVKLRLGPGTNFSMIRVVAGGSPVEIGDCDAAGSWCAVTVNGQTGFISGQYLEWEKEQQGWPRAYDVGKGRMILYQPQFSKWTDFKAIEALVAAEYSETPESKPVFGIIGLKGTTSYDEDEGEIVITDITVTELNFSGLGRDKLTALSVEAGKLLPTGPITLSEARVTASLAEQQRMTDVTGLKADAPKIFVLMTPAILVQTDGGPSYAPVKGKAGLSFVVNTNWDVFRVDEIGALYLRHDTHWLTSRAIEGPWTPVNDLPPALKELPDDGNWDDSRAAIPPEPYIDGAAPKVVSNAAPSEMILFTGEPALENVRGTKLQWASNTETDVFFDKAGKQWYVLLSGRWFRAAALSGPWTFATPDLPADFLNIPEDAPYYAVRSSVPGTSESAEARLKASIPTTARVEAGSVTPTVAYAGDAQFAPVEGMKLSYATNTTDTVIRVGDRYYLLQDGIWFVANTPGGPWQLAREVPEEIYQIPPSSPVYNATFVRVYETEPNAVWYGYTMGYLYSFLAWGSYVYGTGWSYPPYWYNWPGYGYPIYYPRPATWGLAAYYNPVRGLYGRYGYAYGPYRGIAAARTWNPATGTYARAGAAWGPHGSAAFVGAYNPRTDRGGYGAGGRNVYGAWKSAGVRRGSDWARLTGASNVAGGSTLRWNTSNGQGFVHEGRRGDIYAGRDGNVYRNTGSGWQKWNGGWQNAASPKGNELLQRGEGLGGLSPEGRERLQERGGGEALKGLASAGAAGAAGAAIGQRLGGGEQARRDRTDGVGRERAAQRPEAQQRLAPQQRAPSPQRPAQQQRPTATERPVAQQRPAVQRPSSRPATNQSLPTNLAQDAQARQRGNQRQIANRQVAGPASPQFTPQRPSFSSQRSVAPRGGYGGGSFGGGGFSGGRGGGGGFGGRGGGRR